MEATTSSGTIGTPGVPDAFDHPRGLFCNRTLNLRKIGAVGYDMDYTLVHYRVELWEERAYAYIKDGLAALGWPVEDLVFDPRLVIQGLIVDTERGERGQGQPLRLRQARLPRHRAAELRGAAGGLPPDARRPPRAAAGGS